MPQFIQRTVYDVVGPLVKAGMVKPPKWYLAMRQVPQIYLRPSDRIPKVKLPWERLTTQFMERNPHAVDNPVYLGPRGLDSGRLKSLGMQFGKRQWALMQKGLSETDAYNRAMEIMHEEREQGIVAISRMVDEVASSEDARPSFISRSGVYDGLMQWDSMLEDTSYDTWDAKARDGLNTWLRREILRYDDDRYRHSGLAGGGITESVDLEVARLRTIIFPSTRTWEYPLPARLIRFRSAKEPGGKEWVATYEYFKRMMHDAPYEADWHPQIIEYLEVWLVGACVRRKVLGDMLRWTLSFCHPQKDHTGDDLGGTPDDLDFRGLADDYRNSSSSLPSWMDGLDDEDNETESASDGIADTQAQRGAPDLESEMERQRHSPEKQQAEEEEHDQMAEDWDESSPTYEERWEIPEMKPLDSLQDVMVKHGADGSAHGASDTSASSVADILSLKDSEFSSRLKEAIRRDERAPTRYDLASILHRRTGIMPPAEAMFDDFAVDSWKFNLDAIIDQAKRHLLPHLILRQDRPTLTEEEALEYKEIIKKRVMVKHEIEEDDLENTRLDLMNRFKRQLGPPKVMSWEVKQDIYKKGVSRKERKEMRLKAKRLMLEQIRGMRYYDPEKDTKDYTAFIHDEDVTDEEAAAKALDAERHRKY